MLKSSEVLKNRKELLEKISAQHIAKVNEELLAIEKSINKYSKDINDTNDYIDIDMIITTDESKQALKEAEWVIDKSQSVPCGHTWIRPVDIVNSWKADKNEDNSLKTNKEYVTLDDFAEAVRNTVLQSTYNFN